MKCTIQLLLVCILALSFYGCSGSDKPTQTAQATEVPTSPAVSNDKPVSKSKELIDEINTLGEWPEDEDVVKLFSKIENEAFLNEENNSLKEVAEALIQINHPEVIQYFIKLPLQHQNEKLREITTLVLLEKGHGETLAERIIKNNEIVSLYKKNYIEKINVRKKLEEKTKTYTQFLKLFQSQENSQGTFILCNEAMHWQHSVFNEILKEPLNSSERQSIFKDMVELGEVLIITLSADEYAHAYLAASYYSLSKLEPRRSTLQYTYINKALQVAEKLVGEIRATPKSINLASLYFERARILAEDLEHYAYQTFYDCMRAFDQNPNRKDIHEFLTTKVLTKNAPSYVQFEELIQKALEHYPNAAPFLALDLVRYYLNAISNNQNEKENLSEKAHYYLEVFESILNISKIDETLRTELLGSASLLKANLLQIATGEATFADQDIKQAIEYFKNAGKPLPQMREPFSFLFEAQYVLNDFSNEKKLVSALEVPVLRDYIIAYAGEDLPQFDSEKTPQVITLDLAGKDLHFKTGHYILKNSLSVDLQGQAVICENGAVINTQGYDLSIKNAKSIEGCVFVGISREVVTEVPPQGTNGENCKPDQSAPTTPPQAQTGFTGKRGAHFTIETETFNNSDENLPFFRKQTVVLSQGGVGGKGADGGLGGNGLVFYIRGGHEYHFDPNRSLERVIEGKKHHRPEHKWTQQPAQGGRGGNGGQGGTGGEITLSVSDIQKINLQKNTLSLLSLGGVSGTAGEGGSSGILDRHYVLTYREHQNDNFEDGGYILLPDEKPRRRPFINTRCSHYGTVSRTIPGTEHTSPQGESGEQGLVGESGQLIINQK